ncbi:MAG: glycosyltransferase, partial [Anaerolineae bacterium]
MARPALPEQERGPAAVVALAAVGVAPASHMRIVMVGPFGLRRKGTVRARALPLARALVEREHHVTLLLPPWDSPQDAGRRWTDAGVDVVNIHLPRAIPALDHATITCRLVDHVLGLEPDVVHAFKPKAYAGLTATVLWWLRRLRKTDIRLVIDTDDWEGPGGWNEIEPYTPAQRRFFVWQERWGLTHCDAVTVASRSLQTLVWGLGVEPGHVFYVPNGVGKSEACPFDKLRACPEPAEGTLPELRRRVLSPKSLSEDAIHQDMNDISRVGGPELTTRYGQHGRRPEPVEGSPDPVFQTGSKSEVVDGPTTAKRVLLYTRFVEFEVERLVAIWQRVVESVPDAQLVIAGQGLRGEEGMLMRLAHDAGIGERIVYLRWPGRAAMPGVFASVDLAVMP